MRRVLHVNKFYPPWIGGVERVVADLVEGLRDEFDTRALVCADGRPPGSVDGITRVRTHGVLFSMPLSIDLYPRFRAMARQADLIHIHSPFPLGELAAVLDGCRRARVLVSYHCDVVRQRWALPAYAPVIRALLRRADRIHTSSRRIIAGSPILSAFEDKCAILPYGAGPVGAAPPGGPPPWMDAPFVLFVGRLVPYKGVEYLIDAMDRVDSPLVVAGDGPLRSALQRRARARGVSARIRFVGSPPKAILHALLRRCRLLVLPSVDRSEAFGLVQIEAMACGKPVVNTDLPTAVPEVSLHERTGLTVPPRDSAALARAITTILGDPVRCQEYAHNAVDRARELSLERFLEGMRRIYRDLLTSPGA